MDWMKWIYSALMERFVLLHGLGSDASAPGGTSSEGKRQNRFETEAVQLLNATFPKEVGRQTEGYSFEGPSDAQWIVYDDPQGGTVGFTRGLDVGGSVSNLAVGSLLMVQENVPDPTFKSVRYAGMLDLRDGTMYISDGERALHAKAGGQTVKLVTRPMYNRHYPIIGTENTRRANGFWHFLIGHGLYPQVVGDSHSTFCGPFLGAALGEVDFTIAANPPGITDCGTRGDDLGAAAVFFRAMGAYAVQVEARDNQMVVVGPLDDAPYSFDGLTSVVLAPTEKIAQHYLGRINRALARPAFGTTVASVLAELYNESVPNERWQLPIVDDGSK